jgi:hypothetical protein
MMMRRMFTFISARWAGTESSGLPPHPTPPRSLAAHGPRRPRIILAQLEGSGQGAKASYNRELYNELSTFLEKEPMTDSEEWIGKLMSRNSELGEQLGSAGVNVKCLQGRARRRQRAAHPRCGSPPSPCTHARPPRSAPPDGGAHGLRGGGV